MMAKLSSSKARCRLGSSQAEVVSSLSSQHLGKEALFVLYDVGNLRNSIIAEVLIGVMILWSGELELGPLSHESRHQLKGI